MVLAGCCEAIIALFLPPLAVFLRTGCSLDLLINIGLCIFGWIPGIIHAELVILFVPGLREQLRLKQERRRSQREVIEYYDEPPRHHHHRSSSRQIEYGDRSHSPVYEDRTSYGYYHSPSPNRSSHDYPPADPIARSGPVVRSDGYYPPMDPYRRSIENYPPRSLHRRNYDGSPRTGY